VDIVFGGIPCQPHSCAGKQQRQEDERDLVDEFLRIVGEVEPRFAAVENVRGFLAGDGIGRLLGGLADLGFDAEWEIVSAAQVGAPHKRERVFVLAYRDEGGLGCDGGGRLLNREWATRGHNPDGRHAGLADTHRPDEGRGADPLRRQVRGDAPGGDGGELADANGPRQSKPGPRGEQKPGAQAEAGLYGGPELTGGELGDTNGEGLEDGGCGQFSRDFPTPWPPSPAGDWSGVPEWLHPALPNSEGREARTSGRGEASQGASEGGEA
jgi:DNA (cytosine-5)-methyltransferase 1